MRTSACNQLAGRMTRIRQGTRLDEIKLLLAGGERIVCIVSSDRALALRLQPGGAAVAQGHGEYRSSDRTQGR